MIKRVFLNHKQFALLYFIVLSIDIVVKLNCSQFPYRFMSKPWIIVILLYYFYFHVNNKNDRKHKMVFWALLSFLLGDLIILLKGDSVVLLGLTIVFFTAAKLFLSYKFSHNKDFSVSTLIPFTSILFVYTVFMTWFLYDDLKDFFIPALGSFFISLLMLQFAFLRKVVFNKKSFTFVFIGVLAYVASEGMQAVQLFKGMFPMQEFLSSLFYGVGLYAIVFGILNEKESEHEKVEKFDDKINVF
ncbi:lysoplasmalogenase family protein [Hwangdonia lutea]|uniref:Lysoplasmalogenase family protein n=1 Tax=Hwangdonia lutea TaxID=3075823 RepID=A0AA97EMS6_9FLAO|nr:lysoplasmalogenase family protein [Hwangdonia sp. SCSIO 19198]WOD44291.1 lysoplasmalogenase family protein [Hwangdonia sp. SCSIO 19198]